MDAMSLQGYLAGVADSDLFGCLALLSLVLLLTASHRAARNSRLHRALTLSVLAAVVAIHGLGSWYGNLRPA
jgi:asparagine N-glycosylation enzyme membrane subunit Stt3